MQSKLHDYSSARGTSRFTFQKSARNRPRPKSRFRPSGPFEFDLEKHVKHGLRGAFSEKKDQNNNNNPDNDDLQDKSEEGNGDDTYARQRFASGDSDSKLPSVSDLKGKVSSSIGSVTQSIAKDVVGIIMEGLVEDTTQWFTQEMSRRMQDYLAPHLIEYAREETADILSYQLITKLNSSLMTLNKTIVPQVEKNIVNKLKVTVTQILTRSLSRGLSRALTNTLQVRHFAGMEVCTVCAAQGNPEACKQCDSSVITRFLSQQTELQNLEYYSSFFSNYSSAMTLAEGKEFKDTGRTFKPP